jgi:cytochrome c556
MQRLFVLAGALALAVTFSAVAVAEDKKDEKKPKSIKEVMKKAHAGDTAFKAAITKAVKAKEFDDDAKSTMKAWVAIGSHLGEFDPPKGEKDSWKELTKKYAEDLKALAKAVDSKDAEAAGKALKSVNGSCGACHKAHKGK